MTGADPIIVYYTDGTHEVLSPSDIRHFKYLAMSDVEARMIGVLVIEQDDLEIRRIPRPSVWDLA